MNSDKEKTAPISKKDEKQILAGIKEKDKEAFIKAYDLYADQIYRFTYFKVSDEEEAQDLTSIIFLKTWNYIQENSVSDFKTVRGLIYKIARTSIIDHYRKNSKQENIALNSEDNEMQISDRRQDILKRTEHSFDMNIIEQKLQQIKDEYREIIILKYLEDLSTSEIAKIIDKSKGNTRVIIHRALNALKKIIEENE